MAPEIQPAPLELEAELTTLESELPTLEAEQGAAPPWSALETRALKGTFWTVMDYGSAVGLRLVSSLILTRLLMPEIFGLMTLVSTMVVGISLLSDIGLGPNVVQSPHADEPDFLNTVWTLQAVRGIGIFLIAMVLAWPISLVYHDSRLFPLIIALSFASVISGFFSTNYLSLSRHLGIRRQFVVDLATQIVMLVTTIALVLFWKRSVWAIVAGNLVSVTFKLAATFYQPLMPGIVNHFKWDQEHVKSLIRFGKWILLSTAFYFFAAQSDRLILGRCITLSLLGVYGIAYSVSDIPRAIINAFSQKVGFPFIAKMAHLDGAEFRKLFLHYRLRVLLVGALLVTTMVLLGGPLVTIMYDRRYHDASWMVPVLALGLWHTLMYQTTMPALFALGKSHYSATAHACYFAAVVIAIPVAFHFFGIFGAVVAVAAGDLPVYFVTVTGASRERISTWRQDLLMTGVLLILLGTGLAIRKAIGA